jgi:SAM-dependent methyltransferase
MTSATHARVATLEANHFWFAGRDLLVRQLLCRHAAQGPVLDLGAGTGAFAARLAADGHQVVALDRAVPERYAGSGHAVVGDAETLGLRTAGVRTVLARDVLEHVDDDLALRECHRVLAPGGLLVVLAPGWPSLRSDRDVRAGHLRRYRRRALRDRVTRAGFVVLEVRGYQFLALPLLVASRLASRVLGPGVIDREERPGPRTNAVLHRLNAWEAGLARHAAPLPPTGSTLVVVARRS